MTNRRRLSLLLLFMLVFSLLPAPVSAAGYTEVSSALEMAQALADTPAQPAGLRAAQAEPTYVLVLEPVLPDACGAQRVLHYAAYSEYLLEYASPADAERACRTLKDTYGLTHCWLDTPEQGAQVLDSGASAMDATTWGADYMHLTAYKADPRAAAHYDAARPCVAIIDSGVDPDNDQLKAHSYLSYDFVNMSTALAEVTAEKTINGAKNNARGHGTRVASILDSLLPEHTRFMYLRVFDNENGSASRHNVITAIQYAVEHGADVINLSLGWEDDATHDFDFLDGALATAKEHGVTIVCAAGNSRQDVANCYPANSADTIAVSSVSRQLWFESYSNHGQMVDFCAPGSGITATALGGGTVSCTGTSFAAPHITAAVAELRILEPAAAPDRIRTMLRTYAYDLGAEGKDEYYGWGIPVLPDKFETLIHHAWDGGHTLKAATATEDGYRIVTCEICGESYTELIPATGETVETSFVDVDKEQYYAVPVAWASANGITTGTDDTHFSPGVICTRAQVVTFLWRAAGSPDPKTAKNPFTDVAKGAYYYNAILWAVENSITQGTSATTFAPDATCTRAHVVTFLYRFDKVESGASALDTTVFVSDDSMTYHHLGCALLTGSARETVLSSAVSQGCTPCSVCFTEADPLANVGSFTDVPQSAYYADPVAWALAKHITNGMTATTFAPNAGCTRAQIVTFLYRYMNGTA